MDDNEDIQWTAEGMHYVEIHEMVEMISDMQAQRMAEQYPMEGMRLIHSFVHVTHAMMENIEEAYHDALAMNGDLPTDQDEWDQQRAFMRLAFFDRFIMAICTVTEKKAVSEGTSPFEGNMPVSSISLVAGKNTAGDLIFPDSPLREPPVEG